MSNEQDDKAVTADTVPSAASLVPSTSSKKKKSKKEKKRKHEDSPSSSAKKKLKKEKKKDKKEKKKKKSEEQSGAVSKDDVAVVSSSQQLSAPSQSEMQIMANANRTETSPNTFSFISSTSASSNPESQNSPFQVKTILGSVALLPSSLPNVPKTIKSLLHSLLLMYDANMGGVLLSLEDGIKLLPLKPRTTGGRSNNGHNNSNGLVGGRIADDLPYIHYRFQFQGLLFCPGVGMKLKGQVIECTPTFITLTTNHILTTKISTEKLNQQGFFYNGVTLEWTRERVDTAMKQDNPDDEEDVLGPSTSIYLDDTVEFIVERIHECGGYISLDGANPTV